MANFAGMTNLEVWYSHVEIDSALEALGSQLTPKMAKRAGENAREGPHS